MDNLERAGRVLARAFGYGQSWNPPRGFGQARDWKPEPDVDPPEVSEALSSPEALAAIPGADDSLLIRRETSTLIQARDSVSSWLGKRDTPEHELTKAQRRARRRYTPAQLAELWDWEAAHPLTAGMSRSDPYKPREFERWALDRDHLTATPTAMYPVAPAHERALIALGSMAKPRKALLMVYAVEDGRDWHIIEIAARGVLPPEAHSGIQEGMYRILRASSDEARAKRYNMRRADYVATVRPAMCLLCDWLHCAAGEFMQRYRAARVLLEWHSGTVRRGPGTAAQVTGDRNI